MQNLKIGLDIIITSLVVVLLPIIAITLITSRTALGGFQSFTVLSGSMEPLIPTGSIVYTFKSTEIKKGEIITFQRNGINVTHRVIDVVDKNGNKISNIASPLSLNNKDMFYQTKGDKNKSVDLELVPQNRIIGETLIHLPYAGKVFFFVKTLPGFLMVVVVPTFIFISLELWKIKREIEKDIERKTIERLDKTYL